MAKNAVYWAKQKGLTRKNEVHGKEEYKVPTRETFKNKEKERTVQSASSHATLGNAAGILTTALPNSTEFATTHGWWLFFWTL